MNGVFEQLFTLVLVYGYPAVGGVAFVGSAGVPLPLTAILLLAGSLAALGNLNLFTLVPIVAGCGVAGDLLDYYVGRRMGDVASARVAGRGFAQSGAAERARRYFARYSGAAIFLSRWLLTPISSVMSVLAGAAKYPLHKFLIADVAGELLGAVLFLGLGYAVGESWPEIWSFLSGVPGMATAAAAGLALVALGLGRLMQARRR